MERSPGKLPIFLASDVAPFPSASLFLVSAGRVDYPSVLPVEAPATVIEEPAIGCSSPVLDCSVVVVSGTVVVSFSVSDI